MKVNKSFDESFSNSNSGQLGIAQRPFHQGNALLSPATNSNWKVMFTYCYVCGCILSFLKT